MVNNKNTKFLTEILDLNDVKVISHRLHNGIGMILQTESKKTHGVCPNCGTKSYKLHQNQCPEGTRCANDILLKIYHLVPNTFI